MKNPPFERTNQIVSDVAEIAELVGRMSFADGNGRTGRLWQRAG
jgi:hypothetical protein